MKTIGELFAGYGIGTTETMTAQLEQYMKGILSWNEKINLTAIKDPEEFVIKHYVDSLRIAERPEFQAAETVIDVGTGGGFPGVPLAAAAPEKRFLLMDSLNKRIKVILELTAECGIGNVEAVHGRAEDLGRDPQYREQFDLCVSRAVADLSDVSGTTASGVITPTVRIYINGFPEAGVIGEYKIYVTLTQSAEE